jgi:hypothetical protein
MLTVFHCSQKAVSERVPNPMLFLSTQQALWEYFIKKLSLIFEKFLLQRIQNSAARLHSEVEQSCRPHVVRFYVMLKNPSKYERDIR